LSTVEKWWRSRREIGCCSALPHAGGVRRTLSGAEDFLRTEVRVYASVWDVWLLWERVLRLCGPVRLAGCRTAFVPSTTRRTRSLQGCPHHDRWLRHDLHDPG
ncbi:MAG: hypothetical protein ACXVBY_23470, partial [Isosphaeraceae bacterium]